jgi:hypothetical protein
MMTFADTAAATLGEGATNAAASAGAAVQSATDAAAHTITKKDNGWFGFLTGPLETVLKVRPRQTCLSSGLQHGPMPQTGSLKQHLGVSIAESKLPWSGHVKCGSANLYALKSSQGYH